jgi:hypothetical protein
MMFMPQLDPDHKSNANNTEPSLPSWAKNSKAMSLLIKGSKLLDDCIPTDFGKKVKMIFSTEQASMEKKVMSNIPDASKRIPFILNELPKEVLKRVPSDDLVMLQDTTEPEQNKAKVLTDIKKLYEEYMNQPTSHLSQAEISQRDSRYYETMIMIENTINEYDKMLMAPGMPSPDISPSVS